MERVRIKWTHTTDIICVPDIIAKNIDQYTDDFREWVSGVSFDPSITHGTCFGIEQYISFLNDRYLSNHWEKVYLEYENYIPETERELLLFNRMKKIYF